MSVVVTTKKIYDEFTSTGGGGINWLNACFGDKMSRVSEFYVKWALENKRMKFDTTDDSIELLNNFDAETFTSKGFKVGDDIEITDTATNDGSYVIASFINDRKITLTTNLNNATDSDCSVFGTTPVTALDFFYNLIENSQSESYLSLTDTGTSQKYAVSGIDATDLVTETKFVPYNKSIGWITENLDANFKSETKIIGMDISADFQQQFKIT